LSVPWEGAGSVKLDVGIERRPVVRKSRGDADREIAATPAGLLELSCGVFENRWEMKFVGHNNAGSHGDLVKLAGDDRVLNEELKWNDFECILVGGFEDDGTGFAGLLDL
jgi:hypothetical protein